MKRRAYLATAVATTGTVLAGCTGSDSPSADDPNDTNGENGDTDDGPSVETIDDFEDLSVWSEASGSLSVSSDRAAIGSQSARLEVDTSTTTARMARSFDEPLDVSSEVPGIAVASETVASPWLRLLDENGNRIDYRRTLTPDLPIMRYNFGIDHLDDSFDETAVTEVHIQLWAEEGTERTIWVDDLHLVPRPETGTVMIQFDDTHITDYTEALPILEEYGYEAVTFINPDYVGNRSGEYDRLSESQIDGLHDAGWCISNHTVTHARLPDLDRDEQEAEIRDGKEWLERRGYEEGARYFAYPFGEYDETTIELVDEYHDIGFAGGYPVQGYTSNSKLATRISEPDRERAEEVFELTARMPGITCIFYHELEDQLLTDFEDTIEILSEYESRGEIDVILPQDLEERFLV